MALSKKRKRWLIVLGSVFLLLIILTIFANRIISNKAETILREELSKIDSTKYIIDFDRLRVNIWSRSVKLYGVHVIPAEPALEKVKRSAISPPVAELFIDRIRISSIAIMAAISGKEIKIGKISIRDPEGTLYGKGNLLKQKSQGDGQDELFSSDTLASGNFKGARLGSFEIDHANFRYIDLVDNDTTLVVSDLNISVHDIVVHQVRESSQADTLEIGDLNVEIGSHSMELPGGFYSMKIDGFRLAYEDGDLSIESLQLIPAYPIGQFSKAFGKQTDRFDISSGRISLKGLEYDSLMNKKFIAKELIITEPRADICRDKRVARDMNIFPKLFQTAVAELPIQLSIGRISTVNGGLTYKEIVEGAKYPGMVSLTELNMDISGVCNYLDSIKNGQLMFIDARAKLMDEAPVQIYFNLPVGNHTEYFTFHGTAGSFPAAKLNPTLENMIFVEATQGTIDHVTFYGMAMNDTTAGRLELKYSDLGVAVLKKKKEEEGIIEENKFFSFVARTAMHKNNPHPGKEPRIAKMSFVRDPNKGFFNYFWKTIQNGIIVTLTPGKKNLASDMSWDEFKQDWRKVLLNDWNALEKKHEKKKNRK